MRSGVETNPCRLRIHLNSDSAPGESVHHYGHAVDIGFNGLRWINGRGDISTTDDWLRDLPTQPQRLAFWGGPQQDPHFSIDAYLGPGTPPKNARDSGTTPLRDTDITPAHLGAVQRLLRAEFDAADRDWRLWKAVFYQGSARRPSHRK